MQLVIGNKNYSSWSLRPWLLLTEFGIAFEEIQVRLGQDDSGAKLAQYSPAGKVPVLIDGDITVWDSLSICEYLSERYLDERGWPDEPANRAAARSVSAEMHSGFTALRNELPMNCRARRKVAFSEAVLQDIRRIDQIWSSCLTQQPPAGAWLYGRFSIADCMFAPVVLRFNTYAVQVSDSSRKYMDTMLGNSNLNRWVSDAAKETWVTPAYEIGEEIR